MPTLHCESRHAFWPLKLELVPSQFFYSFLFFYDFYF